MDNVAVLHSLNLHVMCVHVNLFINDPMYEVNFMIHFFFDELLDALINGPNVKTFSHIFYIGMV